MTEIPAKIVNYISRGKLPAIYRRKILPMNSLAQMDNINTGARKFPAGGKETGDVIGRTETRAKVECFGIQRPVIPI
jgi:hypothetical protein